MSREILFLAHRVPFPPDRGDKIRSFNMVRHLAGRARLHVLAFADDALDLARGMGAGAGLASCEVIWRGKSRARAGLEAIASGKPVSLTAFADARMRRMVGDLLARHPIDAIVVFSSQMAQYVTADWKGRLVMDFVDMDSAKFAGYADQARGPMAWLMRREAKLLRRFEIATARRADVSLFVSEAEAALFRPLVPGARVEPVENGIDATAYDPARSYEAPATQGRLIVFTGQMDYPPNVEAVRWFARDVLPLIRQTHADVRFAIVGRQPTDAVCALSGDAVIVTGAVDDVRGWLAAAEVVVAPLKLARGIQNKVIEAMAMARPVVATPEATEGIDHRDTIRVAEGADALARAVCALLEDRASADALGRAARARVLDRYRWDACLAPLDAMLALEAPDVMGRDAA